MMMAYEPHVKGDPDRWAAIERLLSEHRVIKVRTGRKNYTDKVL
jgi:hypothetical protein